MPEQDPISACLHKLLLCIASTTLWQLIWQPAANELRIEAHFCLGNRLLIPSPLHLCQGSTEGSGGRGRPWRSRDGWRFLLPVPQRNC